MNSFERRGILCTGDFSYNKVWREHMIAKKDIIYIILGTKTKYVKIIEQNLYNLRDCWNRRPYRQDIFRWNVTM